MSKPRIELCLLADRDEALELLFGFADSGGLSLDGLMVCKDTSGVIGAALAVESKGRTLLCFPPKADPSLSPTRRAWVERNLLAAICDHAKSTKPRLAQLLLADEDRRLAPMLLEYGFNPLGTLEFMTNPLNRTRPKRTSSLEYVRYDQVAEAEFLDVVAESYVGSLDCPSLAGARTIEEALAGHQAQGSFDPQLWLLARKDHRTVGCLLLTRLEDRNAIEIAYLAILPQARGHGLGRELARKAIQIGKSEGVSRIQLAMDAQNQPARRVYQAEGFETFDVQDAYVLYIEPADGRIQQG